MLDVKDIIIPENVDLFKLVFECLLKVLIFGVNCYRTFKMLTFQVIITSLTPFLLVCTYYIGRLQMFIHNCKNSEKLEINNKLVFDQKHLNIYFLLLCHNVL